MVPAQSHKLVYVGSIPTLATNLGCSSSYIKEDNYLYASLSSKNILYNIKLSIQKLVSKSTRPSK